jgi:hypothetical protein
MMTKFFTAGLMAVALLLSGCGSGGDSINIPPNNVPPTPFVTGTGFLEIDQPAINLMSQMQANSVTLSLIADGGTTVLSHSRYGRQPGRPIRRRWHG